MLRTNLPIDNRLPEILSKVEASDVVIIEAETGAGKSTRVGKCLYDAGYDVVITEPRRIAAVSLAQRVADENGYELGKEVGYATAFEKQYSDSTKILYCTDGLQLVREINSKISSKKKVLILDEVHEWNLNIETLLAWAKLQLEAGFDTKLVIMSATLQMQQFYDYFKPFKVNHVSVSGRTFDVSFRQTSKENKMYEILTLIKEGRNILVFEPGKTEIEELCDELKEVIHGIPCKILTLHSEMTIEEQNSCFKTYSVPKIVIATNIAQTSITIPDIDAVVDSGKVKQVEAISGVEGLYLRDCSKADLLQRKGRAGRVKKGKYILCSDVQFDSRKEYSLPEILRLNLEQVVLRLAAARIDAASLKFLHQPSEEAICRAKQLLINLGALSADGKITDLGNKMAKLPTSARASRMLVEAEKLGCLKDTIVIAAVLENGSLLSKDGKYYSFCHESRSDLIAELKVWKKISSMGKINFKELGINPKIFFKVKEFVKKLEFTFEDKIASESESTEDMLRRCIIVGMLDCLYVASGYKNECTSCANPNFNVKLSKKSCVLPWNNTYFIGLPRTIGVYNKMFNITTSLSIVDTVTSLVNIEELISLAPHLFELKEEDNLSYSYYTGKVTKIIHIYYMGCELDTTISEVVTDPELVAKAKALAEAKEQEELQRANSRFGYSSVKVQNVIKVGSRWYDIYDSYTDPYIYIDIDELFALEVDEVKMDNGKRIKFECQRLSSKSINDLKERLKLKMLKNEIDTLKLKLEYKQVSTYPDYLSTFAELGERTVKVELYDSVISETVYVYLYLRKGKVAMDVTTSKEKFEEETIEAIRFLFGNVCESKFNDKDFMFKVDGKLTLTSKGSKARSYFNSEKIDIISQLTFSNFEESVQYLELAYEEALGMLESKKMA